MKYKKTKYASPVGLEPTIFRLTAERGSRLRHRDMWIQHQYSVNQPLPLSARVSTKLPRIAEIPGTEYNKPKVFRKSMSYVPGFQEKCTIRFYSA